MAQIRVESTAQQDVLTDAKKKQKFFLIPFILITSLFFLWGMVHNLDSILIPHLKKACELNNRQSSLVDMAVYFAYFLMAIPAGIFLKRFGYKTGIILGLFIAAFGAGRLQFLLPLFFFKGNGKELLYFFLAV